MGNPTFTQLPSHTQSLHRSTCNLSRKHITARTSTYSSCESFASNLITQQSMVYCGDSETTQQPSDIQPLFVFMQTYKHLIHLLVNAKQMLMIISSCLCIPLSCSRMWRSAVQTEWHHHDSGLAEGIPAQQELCLASGGSHTVPHICAV